MPKISLPADIDRAVRPLFDALPLASAMARLVVASPASAELTRVAEQAVEAPAVRSRPALAAGLWLYVDELDRSPRISQQIEDATGSFWHGIMHRREGDFSNSHYWFRRVGRHPAFEAIDADGNAERSGERAPHGHISGAGLRADALYDPHAFIDRVEAASKRADSPPELVELQRREWSALFAWCAETSKGGGGVRR